MSQFQANEGKYIVAFEEPYSGVSPILPSFLDNGEFLFGLAGTSDHGLNSSFIFFTTPQTVALYSRSAGMLSKLTGKMCIRHRVFRNNQQSRSIFIDTVDYPRSNCFIVIKIRVLSSSASSSENLGAIDSLCPK